MPRSRSPKRPPTPRPDKTLRAIKLQLESASVEVWEVGEPCAFLLRFWCNRHHDYCWQTLEIKPAHSKKASSGKRQKAEFLLSTSTPAVATFESAWLALNRLHALESVRLQTRIRTLEITA
jgi:hypothetical protein